MQSSLHPSTVSPFLSSLWFNHSHSSRSWFLILDAFFLSPSTFSNFLPPHLSNFNISSLYFTFPYQLPYPRMSLSSSSSSLHSTHLLSVCDCRSLKPASHSAPEPLPWPMTTLQYLLVSFSTGEMHLRKVRAVILARLVSYGMYIVRHTVTSWSLFIVW